MDVRFVPTGRQWEAVSVKYMALAKKFPHEVANKDVRDVSLKAVVLTKSVETATIRNELNAPSQVNPNTALANILANIQGKSKAKLIAERVWSRNYVRAGWLQGANEIPKDKGRSQFVPRMRTSPKLGGGNKANTINGQATAEVFNKVGNGNAQITGIQRRGLEQAKALTYFDRLDYIKRKIAEINGTIK